LKLWHDVAKKQGGDIMEQISIAEQLKQKRTYWKQHIDSWQETGLTQAEYCRQPGWRRGQCHFF